MEITEFAQKIKQKYPQYKALEDSLLTQKILDKYPQYNSVVSLDIEKPKPEKDIIKIKTLEIEPEPAVGTSVETEEPERFDFLGKEEKPEPYKTDELEKLKTDVYLESPKRYTEKQEIQIPSNVQFRERSMSLNKLKTSDLGRPLTEEEQEYLDFQYNKKLAKEYPNNYYAGTTAALDAFVQGILPFRELLSGRERKGLEEAYPLQTGAGALAGLIGMGYLTGGVGPAVTGSKILKTLPTVAKHVAGRMAQTGATLGLKKLVDEMAEYLVGDDKKITEVIKETTKSTAWGAGLGAVGSIPQPLLRIPSQAAYGFTTAKLEGASNKQAAIQSAILGLFGLFNTKNLNVQYKRAAYKGSLKALADRLIAKGYNKKYAYNLADRYFRYAFYKADAIKAGKVQWNKVKVKDFDKFSDKLRKGWKIIIEKGDTPSDISKTKLVGGATGTQPRSGKLPANYKVTQKGTPYKSERYASTLAAKLTKKGEPDYDVVPWEDGYAIRKIEPEKEAETPLKKTEKEITRRVKKFAEKIPEGEEGYFPPQIRVEVNGEEKLIKSSEYLKKAGLKPAKDLNYWIKPTKGAEAPKETSEKTSYSVDLVEGGYRWTDVNGNSGIVKFSEFEDDPVLGSAKERAFGEANSKAQAQPAEAPEETEPPRVPETEAPEEKAKKPNRLTYLPKAEVPKWIRNLPKEDITRLVEEKDLIKSQIENDEYWLPEQINSSADINIQEQPEGKTADVPLYYALKELETEGKRWLPAGETKRYKLGEKKVPEEKAPTEISEKQPWEITEKEYHEKATGLIGDEKTIEEAQKIKSSLKKKLEKILENPYLDKKEKSNVRKNIEKLEKERLAFLISNIKNVSPEKFTSDYDFFDLPNKNKEIESADRKRHKAIIAKAIAEGKDIPEKVIKNYPDLKLVDSGEPTQLTNVYKKFDYQTEQRAIKERDRFLQKNVSDQSQLKKLKEGDDGVGYINLPNKTSPIVYKLKDDKYVYWDHDNKSFIEVEKDYVKFHKEEAIKKQGKLIKEEPAVEDKSLIEESKKYDTFEEFIKDKVNTKNPPFEVVQDGQLIGTVDDFENVPNLPMYSGGAEQTKVYDNKDDLIWDSKKDPNYDVIWTNAKVAKRKEKTETSVVKSLDSKGVKSKEYKEALESRDNQINKQGKENPNYTEPNKEIPKGRKFIEYKITEIEPEQYRPKIIAIANKLGVDYTAERIKKMRKASGRYGFKKDVSKKGFIEFVDRMDIGTMSHEVGHLIGREVFNSSLPLRKKVKFGKPIGNTDKKTEEILKKELYEVDKYVDFYDPEQVSSGYLSYRHNRHELFAQYMQLRLLQPEMAKKLAPNFDKGFDNMLKEKPELKKALDEYYKDVGEIKDDTIVDKVLNVFKKVKPQDGIEGIEFNLKDLTKKQAKRIGFAVGMPFWKGKVYPKFGKIYQSIQDHAIYQVNSLLLEGLDKIDLKGINKLPEKSKTLIAKALYRGNDEGIQKYFDENELKDVFKMNPTEISYYKRIVESIEFARDNLIEMLKLKNNYYDMSAEEQKKADEEIRKQIDILGGYFPLQRKKGAKYTVYGEVKDQKGEIIPYFNFTTKNEAIKTANELKNMGYDKVSYYPKKTLPPEFFKKFSHLSLYDLDHIIDALGLPADDPKIKEIREWYLKGRGLSEKIIKRKWVPGFERTFDNMLESLINFNYSSARRLGKYTARKNANKALEEIDPRNEKELYRFASKYIDNYFGTTPHEFANIRKGIYIYYLALKPSFFLQNVTQTFLTNLPELTKYVGFTKASKNWVKAFNYLKKPIKKIKNKELKEYLTRAQKEGLISGQFTEYVLGIKRPIQHKTERALGILGELSEHINRTHDFIAAYHIGKEDLGLIGEKLYKFAENIVHKCQYPFGRQNMPQLVEGAGSTRGLMKLSMVFRSFLFNYLHWYKQTMVGSEPEVQKILEEAAKNNKKTKGKAWKGKLGAILTSFLLGGIFAIPFMGLILKWIRGRTGIDFETRLRKGLKDKIKDEKKAMKYADFIVSGVPGYLGVDSRYLLGFGYPIMPGADAGEVFLGAGYGMIEDGLRGIEYLRKGEKTKAAESFAPTTLENMIKAYEWKTGGIRWGEKYIEKSPSDKNIILRGIGLQPMEVSRRYSSREQALFEKNFVKKMNRDANEVYYKAWIEKDKEKMEAILDYIEDWNKTHPDYLQMKISITSLKRKFSESQRESLPSLKYLPKRMRQRSIELEKIYGIKNE